MNVYISKSKHADIDLVLSIKKCLLKSAEEKNIKINILEASEPYDKTLKFLGDFMIIIPPSHTKKKNLYFYNTVGAGNFNEAIEYKAKNKDKNVYCVYNPDNLKLDEIGAWKNLEVYEINKSKQTTENKQNFKFNYGVLAGLNKIKMNLLFTNPN